MNAGTRSIVTAAPLIAPVIRPTTRPVSTASGSGRPRTRRSAQITPESPTTEPTERSMPAVRMTNVIPAARMAVNAFWRSTFDRFAGVKNESVASARTTHSSASATKMA